MGCSDTKWLCLPVQPCPPPVIPPPALVGPIRGQTNGSPAAPGMVGEFQITTVTGNITVATNALTVTTVIPLTLPAGDWDVEALLNISLLFSGAQFVLNPTLNGASSNMLSAIILPAVVHQLTTATLVSPRTQLLTGNALTQLKFDITATNNTAASVTGAYSFTVNARRMR